MVAVRPPSLRLARVIAVTCGCGSCLRRLRPPPPAGRPGHGSEAVLRRRPARIVDGRFEGGNTGMFELICPDCGDRRDLDYSAVSWRLQWLRGPYRLEAGLAAFHLHLGFD